ncbi:MAG: 3-deoxy-manno-octulosonate cytidylyltransferase [Alphaproteobacteria bacterium]|nr:3-deoxy-manno-octulosonate cytidylyltransferase [Alphaproteobacteria bacterium]
MRPNVHSEPENTALDGVAVIIPARMAASRLPGKPLAMIGDAPMIVQVMRRAYEAGFGQGSSRVIVACDDQAIADAVTAHGGEAILTDPDHPSGSDRVHEALNAIDPDETLDVVVNLQGDLPEIDAAMLVPLVAALRDKGADISTPVARASAEEIPRPQVVKAAIAFDDTPKPGDVGRVLYFSRHAIPHGGGTPDVPIWHHVGIYAWRRSALKRFVSLPPSPLEQTEKLEQLRALEDGMTITALVVDTAPGGIDTPEDLNEARLRLN